MRDKLEAAWNALYPETGFQEGGLNLGLGRARFRRLLDAEAWLDAAMMLVPEGACWTVARYWCDDLPLEPARYFADVGDLTALSAGEHGLIVEAIEATPAEAILAAILKANAPVMGNPISPETSGNQENRHG